MTEFEKGLLKYFCKEDLKKIQQTKIGIAGAGGLGSNCAMLLVRSGFIHFTIVDFDRVEVSNLNRQNYVYSQVNQSKVAALKENLAQIHSNVQIEAVEDRLARDNIKEIFSSCD
ncbi:ThiF family adenylyltransferase, partial [Anaerosinus sp.]|uniref:ThiF family adenylyltransferase n=1 Tax=Selenobaculum sp. TaxID=3074374 RepID=UPI003AB84F32